MEVNRDPKKNKVHLGLICSKYMLFVLNVVFAILSVLMISGGISTTVIFSSFYSDMGDGLRMLSIFWLVAGIVFMFVAVFGIFAAFKESTVLANLYGIAMVLVFIFQIAAAIAGFTLISRSRYMVSDQLNTMMSNYNDYYFGKENVARLDWIQSKFECCGNKEPSDWQNYGKFATPTPDYWSRYPTTRDYWYRDPTTDYYYRADDFYNNHYARTTAYPTTTTTTTTTTTEAPRTDLMPASCCVQYSNYVNLSCEKHHTSGCFEPIHQIVSESIMMIGSSALVFAVIQGLGIVLGFMYARIIRRKKTQRDVQIWNSGTATPSSLPPYADYTQVDNQGEVRYL